ncbi:MAG: hypothetical protein WB779_05390 [Ignavibacteriaceae bacterium]
MENTKGSITKYFLPSYFRIVGLVLIIVSIIVLVFATIVKAYYEFFPAAHQMLMFNKLSFVCGLSLIIFSKEKSENDEINKSRFNALAFSLAASVLILIVFEVINILNSQAPLYAVDFLIIEMCVYYIFFRMKK